MPGTLWIGPTVNRAQGAMGEVRGVVLHIQQGTEAGTEAWMRNPQSRVSAHFLLPRSGGRRQMVDTADKAWCQIAGNPHFLSIECEGLSGQALTSQQVEEAAQILAWAHSRYGVPLVPTDNPTPYTVAQGGLGYHAMGGYAWGGHFDCPGRPIIAQRGQICARARQLLQPPAPPVPSEGEDMLALFQIVGEPHVYASNGVTCRWVPDASVAQLLNWGNNHQWPPLFNRGQITEVTPDNFAALAGVLVGPTPPAA